MTDLDVGGHDHVVAERCGGKAARANERQRPSSWDPPQSEVAKQSRAEGNPEFEQRITTVRDVGILGLKGLVEVVNDRSNARRGV